MLDHKMTRRRFLQGSALLAALSAFPITTLRAAARTTEVREPMAGVWSRPLFSNHHGVIVLPDMLGQADVERLSQAGFTVFVPTLASYELDSALATLRQATLALQQSAQQVHIIGGNLAILAANRIPALDRVVVLGGDYSHHPSSASFAFEAPRRSKTLCLNGLNSGTNETTWAHVVRWLSNSGKAV
jgi:hypothetical protein